MDNDSSIQVTSNDSQSNIEYNSSPSGLGYTHPNLHRTIDLDPVIEPGKEYPFIYKDENGVPYKQNIKLGTWDGIHSYRTTETITHDEESTTCEIP